MNELRKINFDEGVFECGGRKFFKHESLSFVRYRQLQFIMLEFGYSATFQDIFENLKLVWDDLNKLKLAEAAVKIHNIMNGITKLENKDDAALRICALFLDEADENPTIYDESMMRDKINCWSKELDIKPFFYLAASLVPGWMPAYEVVIQNGLKENEKGQ
jgi:hypothetical protein